MEPEFKGRPRNWKFIDHATTLPVFSAGYFCLPPHTPLRQQQNTRTRWLHRAGGAVKALVLLCVFFPGSWKNRAAPVHHSDETLRNARFAKA